MRFDYNNILRNKLYDLQAELGLSNFIIEVDSEQAFLKKKDLQPNTIYVLTRVLQNDRSIAVDTQPIQILILSEQNSLDICKALFSEFAKRYNFEAISFQDEDGNIWMKQQYSDPVVLSNFNSIDYGYRSVLYVSATLYIMYDVVDVSNLTIDGKAVEALNFNVTYSMQTNTQQLPNEYIAKSMKTVSTFAITMMIPMLKSDFVSKVLYILKEETILTDDDSNHYDGNNAFDITFDFAVKTDDTNKIEISKTMRLISAQITTAPNQVPSLQLGFMK